jgi:hypothetical protein
MGFDTHMILEIVPVLLSRPATSPPPNRTSRHFAGALGLQVLFYRAAVDLSRSTWNYVSGIIRRHRKTIGSRWRLLNPSQQALLGLVYVRKGETLAEFAAGFGVSTTTAWRYVRGRGPAVGPVAQPGVGRRRDRNMRRVGRRKRVACRPPAPRAVYPYGPPAPLIAPASPVQTADRHGEERVWPPEEPRSGYWESRIPPGQSDRKAVNRPPGIRRRERRVAPPAALLEKSDPLRCRHCE